MIVKKYTALEMELIVLEQFDVIRTSGNQPNIDFDENELPLVPIFNK